jgi:sugar fermentation stimulation protein A
MQLYPFRTDGLQEAAFLERPNRFLVRCERKDGKILEAFLPNPGRLQEMLLPGVKLYIRATEPHAPPQSGHRKTSYTVLAAQRCGRPVMLHTHLTNSVARLLLKRQLIPGLERTQIVREEVPLRNSRIDFLLREEGKEVFLEVKSCTLFGDGVAMFPDAVTGRGKRHLEELAAFSRKGNLSTVLFLVSYPDLKWFMPDYHTDLAFAQTLVALRDRLRVIPVALRWQEDLSLDANVRVLDIPWDFVAEEVKDRGSYLLLLELDREWKVEIGGLGSLLFPRGHYVYVGSAMKNLTARVHHHQRPVKRPHWHIDYLRPYASSFQAFPIRASARLECKVAEAASGFFHAIHKGFGSSDCGCQTHLFLSRENPLHLYGFHDFLQSFRMRQPALGRGQSGGNVSGTRL